MRNCELFKMQSTNEGRIEDFVNHQIFFQLNSTIQWTIPTPQTSKTSFLFEVRPTFIRSLGWRTVVFFFFSLLVVYSKIGCRRTYGPRLDVLIFFCRLRSYHVLISYSAECSGPKFHKTLVFLGQAGTFLSFQARRSSAVRSLTSDVTVVLLRTTLG